MPSKSKMTVETEKRRAKWSTRFSAKISCLVADGNEAAHEPVDGEALYYKGHEAEKPQHGHLEDPDMAEVGHIVVPLGGRPVVPELPDDAGDEPGQKKQRHGTAFPGEEFGQDGTLTEAAVDGVQEERKPHPYQRGHPRGREDQRDRQAQESEDDEGPENRIREPWMRSRIFSRQQIRQSFVDEEHGRGDGGE